VPAALALWSAYDAGYAFPRWALEPAVVWAYGAATRVFHHAGADVHAVRTLAEQREPCNIAMHRHYDQTKMSREFGYRVGAYGPGMPNIAVYCKTPVRRGPSELQEPVRVINLIGLAFDDPRQPDVARYMHSTSVGDAGRDVVHRWGGAWRIDFAGVLEFYVDMWRLTFGAARSLGVTTLVAYGVGSGAFNAFDTPEEFIRRVHLPAIEAARDPAVRVVHGDGLLLIPDALFDSAKLDALSIDLSTTLWVNAWDPWSVVGNGNAADASLDGYWGRSTALAVLSWPITNPHMSLVAI